MLYWLSGFLHEYYRAFSVFRYLTLRSIMATITALLITLFLGPYIIRRLSMAQIGQIVRTDGPKTHLSKSGTPTMGGVLVLTSICMATLLWANLNNLYVWILLLVTVFFGLVGWVDDYKKLILKNSRGLPGRWKLIWQSTLAITVASILFFNATTLAQTGLHIPFLKNIIVPLGPLFIVFSYFVIVGTSNAVNLTDGLDGLAILPAVMVGGALGVFAYITSHKEFANYLSMSYIPGVEEVVIYAASLVGAGLGFLWFNAYPAQIFMGDVGALSLGAALGTMAIIVRQELVLFIMGGVFVLETVSVMLQVASFKLRGKRIFRMAPIHHHFELSGWPEPRVIVRFWIVTILLVLFGLATIKLR